VTVLQLSLRLLLFIFVGFLARKLKVMPDGFDKMLSKFVLAVPLPCMIVSSFRMAYSVENLLTAPMLILLSVGSMAVMFLLVFAATAWMKDRDLKKTVRFSLLFTNFTFVGFSVVKEVCGEEGFFYYVLFTLPIRVMFYGGAAVMLGKTGAKLDVRETVKKFLCAPVIAVFIGFALYASQLTLPSVISTTLETIGSMASPLGLMLCGAIIADADLRSAVKHPSVLLVTFCRLLLIPAAAIVLFRLIGVKTELIRSTVYYFAMPVASLTPTFLLRYDPEAEEARTVAGYVVVASTLFCVLTIPLWTLLLDRLFA
jgi:predicted permease